jgi:hypothetical protein
MNLIDKTGSYVEKENINGIKKNAPPINTKSFRWEKILECLYKRVIAFTIIK